MASSERLIDSPRVPIDSLRDLISVEWRAPSLHYVCKDYADLPTVLVLLAAIEPPRRDKGVADFDVTRLRRLAYGIANGMPIPPIEVGVPLRSDAYQYRVRNGFHRFYLCKELGFTMIPVVEIDD
jgi:hypothetical protein